MTADQPTNTLQWPQDVEPILSAIQGRYPTARAAIMPLLWEAQKAFGYISDEAAHLVAHTLGVPVVQVQEVVSFYVMYHSQPVGTHVIWRCRNLTCHLRGAEEIAEAIEGHLGIKEGQTTEDGAFTLLSNECLGACGGAPMIQVDQQYYENLTPQSVCSLLDQIREGQAGSGGTQ